MSGLGLVQVVLVLVIELFLLLSIISFKPHETRGADVLVGVLAGARVGSAALSFAFVEQYGVGAMMLVMWVGGTAYGWNYAREIETWGVGMSCEE